METVLKTIFDARSAMDVKSDGEFLFVIRNLDQAAGGSVCKYDADGRLLREFTGIGNARQIGIIDGILVVSARENGLWLLSADDLSPLSHYQTVEFATGVTLSHGYAFISCRQFGVEIVDISEPRAPRHVGIIRVGEVQSACIDNGILYGGIWGEMAVRIVDVRDPSAPKHLGKIELQGRGDGVTVRDGILYAAIGQHRRGVLNIADENDPFFGKGNGFEVFDVRDSNNIIKIRTEFFLGKHYHPSFDTWKAYLSGDILVITNSVGGLYAYSLPDFSPLYHVPMTMIGEKPDAVTGAAVCKGKLIFSTGRGGVFTLNDPKRTYEQFYSDRSTTLPKSARQPFWSDSDKLKSIFPAKKAPVLGVCRFENGFAIANADEGIAITDGDFNLLETVPTDGCCTAVGCAGDRLFTAESAAGFSVYARVNGKLARVATLGFSESITQLFVDPRGRFALVGGGKTVFAVDISDALHPKTVAARRQKRGPLYGDNFAPHETSDGTALLFWHRDGLVYYNPDKFEGFCEIFYYRHTRFMGFGPENGIDTDGERIYYNLDGGLVALPLEEQIFADDLEKITPEIPIRGKFSIFDGKVYACERAKGIVTVTALSDPKRPLSIARIGTSASCGKPVEIDGKIYIPGGYGGLLRVDP